MSVPKKRLRSVLGCLVGACILLGSTFFFFMHRQPLQSSRLTSKLEMGATTLLVQDLAIMKSFYVDSVGLDALQEDQNSLILGFASRPILRLQVDTEHPFPSRSDAGLYHNAILFASRPALAQTLQRMLETQGTFFQGSSDHAVSEAFYFVDPEGNGLELYFDKDASTWRWENGRVVMGSTYIDPIQYIRAYGTTSASDSKKMGHVHLKVGSIEEAKSFYVDLLGLSITAEVPSALFISDGTYHHNFGLNTWESQGARPRLATLGLKSVEIFVESSQDLDKLTKRLHEKNVTFQWESGVVVLSDPWNNRILIGAQGS